MIQYTNLQDQPITQQQFQSMKEYKIVTIDDNTGKIKLIEETRLAIKTDVPYKDFDYFLNPNEDKNIIIQEYINKEYFSGLVIYMNKQSAYGFELWEYEYYNKDGVFRSKGKRVFDSRNRVIASVNINMQTNEIDYFSTPNKYLYFDSFTILPEDEYDDELIIKNVTIKFYYKINSETGEPFFEAYLDTKETEWRDFILHFKFQDLLEMSPNFMQEHSYYSQLLPLLPTTENI